MKSTNCIPHCRQAWIDHGCRIIFDGNGKYGLVSSQPVWSIWWQHQHNNFFNNYQLNGWEQECSKLPVLESLMLESTNYIKIIHNFVLSSIMLSTHLEHSCSQLLQLVLLVLLTIILTVQTSKMKPSHHLQLGCARIFVIWTASRKVGKLVC